MRIGLHGSAQLVAIDGSTCADAEHYTFVISHHESEVSLENQCTIVDNIQWQDIST